ncbi:hypothetical protein BMR07_02570 [Methylococcaceae bacterium CS1]|nr:hypothetical protein BMR11_02315 [Methylococcaceae bacterium CS5]TXL03646.1 hypothetical protein BMR08_17040 [Methylococcaceae bacterium CS2]TXL08224.1 hypothetical protein BMR07_02570 [Methylococcaceae bacterium CS1]
MIAIVRLFKYELLVNFFIIAFPLYVTIFITPVWTWLLFSIFYAAAYLFLVRPIKHYVKVVVLLFAMLPFLFFDALLLVTTLSREPDLTRHFISILISRGF